MKGYLTYQPQGWFYALRARGYHPGYQIKEITECNNYRITSVFSHQADLSL